MPFYRFDCSKCDHTRDVFMVIDDYQELKENQICKCTNKMSRVFLSPQITLGFKEYFDIGLSKMVSSKREIREIEKRQGKVFGGDAELGQEADKNLKYNIKKARKDAEKEMKEGLKKVLAR